MANLFDKYIQDFLEVNGGVEDALITSLRAKKQELGEDAPESVVKAAVQQALASYLGIAPSGQSEPAPASAPESNKEDAIVISEEDAAYMAATTAVVKAFLDENDWHYSVKSRRPDLTTFELGFSLKGCNIKARVHVEADPRVCRFDAILPITAEALYEYPLCLKLAQFNYPKRFGGLKYDHRDGELMYSYSILSSRGIYEDELDILFHTVVGAALEGFEEIRRCAVGRFVRKDIDDILQKVNALVEDITG